jgi:FKBP-type peptidyl-prolyl cis-trans isomerase
METRFTPDQAMEKINAAFMRLQSENDERMWLEGQKNIEEGETFLAENRARSGVTTTPSGLQYEVITEGTGEKPGPYDDVLVHYEGTFLDGTVFDSSYMRGSPADFNLSEVIAGWTEGVQLMSEGSTYRFVIPAGLAYGPGGNRSIPPNAVLIFMLELITVLH